MDRPKSGSSTTDTLDESTSTSFSPGNELSSPHLLPMAKNLASSRLEFSGRPILSGKYLPKSRQRRLSGHSPRSSDLVISPSPIEAPDFARSCPDRGFMNGFGLMNDLISAVDIISARQNQWCSSNDAKSTLQVLKAAQSSTLLFVQKSVDDTDEDSGRLKDLRYFDEDSACSVFFKHSTCYDVLPESGKLLVLDANLPIRRAMQALLDHSLAAAPVWCNRIQSYIHLLTSSLCLRLLAQAFSRNAPTASTSDAEDCSASPDKNDPALGMKYWENKALGDVLKTFFDWALYECQQEEIPGLVTMVTPQDHLHRVTQILTLATSSSKSGVSPPPDYVLIKDQCGSGNLLGLLNADRVLAYLRVRMRSLPTPRALKINASDLVGIRWEERGWYLAHSTDFDDTDSNGDTNSDCCRRRRRVIFSGAIKQASFYVQPTLKCREALHLFNAAWSLAGLPCLPVAMENGMGFEGMLTKQDILETIFDGPVDVALEATVGTIMSIRPRPTGYTNQAMCFTSECLVAVLDRMFRQKAPCLAVFERPGSGASWNGQRALGPAIGVITSADILHAIVVDAPPPASSPSTAFSDIPNVFAPKAAIGKSFTDQSVENAQSHGNHQFGINRIFHRSKRNSDSDIFPLEGPFMASTNSQSQRPQEYQSSRSGHRSTDEASAAGRHPVDDGALFEMDECA